MRSAQQRLGIPLPQALRDGYRLCGRREYPLDGPYAESSHPDRLLRPDELWLDAGQAALVYRVKCGEPAMQWAARLTGEPDPPVVYRETDGMGQWQAFLPSVSWAWVEMVLADSVFSEERGDDRWVDRDDPARLEQGFEQLSVPECPTWWVPGEITRWFGAQDVILRQDGDVWLWACCRTAAALTWLYAAMPGDWSKLQR